MANFIADRRGLAVSPQRTVTIGGLEGVVLDLALAKRWTKGCDTTSGPVVPIIVGAGSSSLDHAIIPGLTMRLFLLAHNDKVLAIEIDDVSDGAHLDDYEAVVNDFKFLA